MTQCIILCYAKITKGDVVHVNTFGKVLRNIRFRNGWTLEEMAQRLGTSKQVLSKYERNERLPKAETAWHYAQVLGIDVNDFFTDEEIFPADVVPISALKVEKVPLISAVAAGSPILAEESYDIYVDSPVKADYALTVKGDSMSPTYLDGDIVYIRQQDDVTDGTVAVVLIDDSACLKHVYKIKNGVQLVSDNPAYPPMIRTWPEYDTIRILGIVVGFTRMYKGMR
jgi:repressor LexA